MKILLLNEVKEKAMKREIEDILMEEKREKKRSCPDCTESSKKSVTRGPKNTKKHKIK